MSNNTQRRSKIACFLVSYDYYRRDVDQTSGRIASAILAHRQVRREFNREG